jgi:mono/diheme cytochrome c family protein
MNRPARLFALLPCVALALGACKAQPRFTGPQLLGAQQIPAQVLNEGHDVYMQNCYACHGEHGDGNGPSAPGLRPPPRDFTAAVFKFGGVRPGELPNDEDLIALVKHGLAGTAMQPWDLSDRERYAVVQYLKTFSERWKTEPPGERVVADTPDPWIGREAEAARVGETIFHLAGVEMDPVTKQPKTVLAGCNVCHPSYLTRDELATLGRQVLGRATEPRPQAYRPERKESEYRVKDVAIGFLPTDFLHHTIKNGATPEALFRTIAAGVGGTAMPTWKGSLRDQDLWALTHYVARLASMRDTPGGAALQAKLLRPGNRGGKEAAATP